MEAEAQLGNQDNDPKDMWLQSRKARKKKLFPLKDINPNEMWHKTINDKSPCFFNRMVLKIKFSKTDIELLNFGCSHCYHIEGWESERRKWHFTNFTGEQKQKMYHSLIWCCVLILIVYNTKLYTHGWQYFSSRKSSLRAFILYLYKNIYLSISPKNVLTPFWFSPLDMEVKKQLNNPQWDCLAWLKTLLTQVFEIWVIWTNVVI